VPHVEHRTQTVPTVDNVTEMVEKFDTVIDQVTQTKYVTDMVPVDTPVVTNHVRTSYIQVPVAPAPQPILCC
jgi:hypothetical protein